jgi:glucosamine 6-phosphate synthetase-like amidotransferase/phosphosugar isomerase protein
MLQNSDIKLMCSKDVVILSHSSGETADTMAAIKLAKAGIRIWRL